MVRPAVGAGIDQQDPNHEAAAAASAADILPSEQT